MVKVVEIRRIIRILLKEFSNEKVPLRLKCTVNSVDLLYYSCYRYVETSKNLSLMSTFVVTLIVLVLNSSEGRRIEKGIFALRCSVSQSPTVFFGQILKYILKHHIYCHVTIHHIKVCSHVVFWTFSRIDYNGILCCFYVTWINLVSISTIYYKKCLKNQEYLKRKTKRIKNYKGDRREVKLSPSNQIKLTNVWTYTTIH